MPSGPQIPPGYAGFPAAIGFHAIAPQPGRRPLLLCPLETQAHGRWPTNCTSSRRCRARGRSIPLVHLPVLWVRLLLAPPSLPVPPRARAIVPPDIQDGAHKLSPAPLRCSTEAAEHTERCL